MRSAPRVATKLRRPSSTLYSAARSSSSSLSAPARCAAGRPRSTDHTCTSSAAGQESILAGVLLDEEDLRVARQRPEVLGDDPLELVRHLADAVHRRDHLVADVLRPLEPLELLGRVVLRLEVADREAQLLDQLAGLARERP